MIDKKSTFVVACFSLATALGGQTCSDGQEKHVCHEANLRVSLLQNEYALKVGALQEDSADEVKQDHAAKEVGTDDIHSKGELESQTSDRIIHNNHSSFFEGDESHLPGNQSLPASTREFETLDTVRHASRISHNVQLTESAETLESRVQRYQQKMIQLGKESKSRPSLVFHVLGYQNDTIPWAEDEKVHLFSPSKKYNSSCEADARYKPLGWPMYSRTEAPPEWWAAQRQYMPSLKSLLAEHPDADYYMMVDSDTVVFREHLHSLLLELETDVLDEGDDLYMGHGYSYPVPVGKFIMTGGGALLHGRTLRKLNDTGMLDQCIEAAVTNLCWHHCDWTLAECMRGIGVMPTGHPGFQQFANRQAGNCAQGSAIACHPIKNKEKQVRIVEWFSKFNGTHKQLRLTKHLAEACDKYYDWYSADHSRCQHGVRPSDLTSLVQVGERVTTEGQRPPGARNMCVQNRIVPELMILGTQKAATTSLSQELSTVPGILLRRVFKEEGDATYYSKEAHIFEDDDRWNGGMDLWLKGYPTCTADTRIVTMDATPNYLLESDKVPARISERYGVQAQHLKFTVILREPLARMHSAFYHYRKSTTQWGLDSETAQVFQQPFSEYIELLLSTNGSTPARNADPYQNSRYVNQLADFFEHFDVDQFVIVPFQTVVKGVSFAQHLAKQVGLPPPTEWMNAGHSNVGSHPKLEKDLSPSLTRRAQEFIYGATGPQLIGQLLVEKRAKAANLYGFKGDPSSANDIAQWLQDAW